MKKYRLVLCFVIAVMLLLPTFLLFASGKKVKEEQVLSILCFAEAYAIDEWVYPFEEMYDCKVNRTYAGTVEEHYSKTKAAPDQYNIISIMSSRVRMYYDDGLIQEISVDKLTHWPELDTFFREGLVETIEPGKEFYVPIAWGNQDFIVNTKVVGDKLKPYLKDLGGGMYSLSYDVLKAPEIKGLTALFDEAASLTNMAAIAAGVKDPSNLDERGYKMMIAELSAWAKNARSFTGGVDAEKAILTAEDAYISLTGNNVIQANLLVEEGYGDTFTHFLPTEGTVLWVDGWVITKPTDPKSAAFDLAMKYIDYMIGAEVQTIMSEKVGWGVVNPAGSGGYSDAVKERTYWYTLGLDNFPVPLYVMKGEEDPPRRERTWNEIKAGIGF